MNQKEYIIVPFSLKSKAKELGALFDKTIRKWYIPEGISEENKELLLNLKDAETSLKELETLLTFKEEEPSSVITLSNEHKKEWDDLLNKSIPIEIVMGISKFGIPGEEKQRIKMLKILSSRRPDQYPISYRLLSDSSKDFQEVYPTDKVLNLIYSCVTGKRNYAEEINHSALTEEEKALLFFVLPIDE